MMENSKTSFYSREELAALGLKSYGKNVLISRYCRIYNPQNVVIGDNVRIDDFTIISAGKSVIIGNYVHIACYVSIIGSELIKISDFCGLSGRVSIYSSSDDYSGTFLSNPMVSEVYTNVTSAPVILEKHVIVGCASVILPGLVIKEGTAIGALSLVQSSCEPNMIYSGNPLKRIIPRSERYKDLEKEFLSTKK